MAFVRLATPDDAAIIVEYSKAMAKESENVILPDDVIQRGVTTAINENVGAMYYLVEDEGKVVGQLMITTEWSDWRCQQIWWIQSVYVHPDFRRRGHFRLLYKHVREEAAKKEACGLRLYADNHNTKAQAVYESLGMTSHYKVYEDLFTAY